MASGTTETTIRIDPETAENGQWLSRADFMAATGVIERTLSNRIKSGYYTSRLTPDGTREIFLSNKTVTERRLEVTESTAGNISNDAGNDPETISGQDRKPHVSHPENAGNANCENCDRLQGRVDMLEQQLKSVEIAYAKLEGQMEGKDSLLEERNRVVEKLEDTVKAKEQAINAANGMVLLYEENKQSPKLETTAESLKTEGQEKPRPWWQKLRGK